MMNVTKTFLPPMEEYQKILSHAWDKHWITNRGDLVLRLEKEIASYLKTAPIIAMTNGTLPIQIAIKALELKGEIITTPFSYVATTSSIVWEGCKPIFVDIHPEYLTIDETKIEQAITPYTSAILATHVYGNPCNVEAIEKIAKTHGLKVIYDAAHCFGVTYKGRSVFNYGDVSTCSFHATKVFHTGEGGALFSNDPEIINALFYHHNFGHKGHESFYGIGVNAKMSELQAALGLAILPYFEKIKSNRLSSIAFYKEHLDDIASIQFPKTREHVSENGAYFPIVFDTETRLLNIVKALNDNSIVPRRYFYPSLNKLPYVAYQEMPISESISKRIVCLPLYYGMDQDDLRHICKIIKDSV
ncbi:DegT/DnrJ/EryC1/StrS family aminotransferase [Sungkyunkwania multivorans]|uniref:DegT/DnrJ/EryC1/StrS family aminotransferase n=1 Tax=Sungkyunkwania multivorans TaxID=1173618 RepID=A0ABW3D1Y2_9FLAO